MSLYAADGSLNITVVPGTSVTGLQAADGSLNVVQSAGGTPIGIMHSCGALNVTNVAGGTSPVSYNAEDGSVNVIESPYSPTGALKVTVVSGTLT